MGTLSVHQESVVCVDARYYRMTCYFMLFYNGNSFCSQAAAGGVLVLEITGCHAALCSSVMELFLFPGGSSGSVGTGCWGAHWRKSQRG